MMLSNVLFWKKCFDFQFNRRVAQMLQCTCSMHHDAPFCNRNVHICAHFYYEICYVCLSGEFGDLWDGSISKSVSGIPIANVSAFILDNGCPDNKFHETNMGPIWGRQDPGGPHVGPMYLVIWVRWRTGITGDPVPMEHLECNYFFFFSHIMACLRCLHVLEKRKKYTLSAKNIFLRICFEINSLRCWRSDKNCFVPLLVYWFRRCCLLWFSRR